MTEVDPPHGRWSPANLHSLTETARANGLEPYHYQTQVFRRLPAAERWIRSKPCCLEV
ncbi:MAG: transposase domain-containing protein [Candidatus Sedimenticola endophacoides]